MNALALNAVPREADEWVNWARASAAPAESDVLNGFVEMCAGGAAILRREFSRAAEGYDRAIELCARSNNRLVLGVALAMRAIRGRQANWSDLDTVYRSALVRFYTDRAWVHVYLLLGGLAEHWARQGDSEAAGVVLGFLDRHNPVSHPMTSARRREAHDLLTTVPEAVGWRAQGAVMTRDNLVAYVLDRLV